LIVTTYNRPKALFVVLKSVLMQEQTPDEVVVADDGSQDETREVVESLTEISPIPIVHVWQKNRGFQAARIRNKAIAKARNDYLILIDGDIVLHPAFVKDHLAVARTARFVQGGRALLGKKATRVALERGYVQWGLYQRDVKNRKNLIHSEPFARHFSAESNRLMGAKTCNLSLFKSDAIRVNGFDNCFLGWGREDSEFICRLINSGVRRFNLRFGALTQHLFHPHRSQQALSSNDELLHRSVENYLTWCEDGLDQYL
jgi:glycosyltransferase involved in cell wall biosynthesis